MISNASKRHALEKMLSAAVITLLVLAMTGLGLGPVHADDAPGPAVAPSGTNASPSAGSTTTGAASQEGGATADLPTAIYLVSRGKQDEALAIFNMVLQKEPQNIKALLLRGDIFMIKQQWEPAAKDFQAVLQIDNTNGEAKFDLADLKFMQHQFDDARTAFVALPESKDDDLKDLTSYKIFLCDLLGGHEDAAAKEFAAFNQAAGGASYYFGNAAWSLVHKKTEEARTWLMSAANIYPARKHMMYMGILKEMGYLPLPPAPAAH